MPTSTDPPPAIASALPIQPSSSKIEKDFTVYGDEITFGGGKVIRDGMGQNSTMSRRDNPGVLDLVITNAVIIDHWGIVKGDIGIRDGRIVKSG